MRENKGIVGMLQLGDHIDLGHCTHVDGAF